MIVVGTSGWQYDHWRGHLYPPGLPKTAWLQRFAEAFPAVELNSSFYQLPRPDSFVKWREGTPDGFCFAVKASRYVTHIRRLRGAADSVELLWSRALGLGDKLGPVLFQLPPRFRVDVPLLASFVAALPSGMRAAFEFRDRSWEGEETWEVLDRAGAAFVLADRPAARVPQVVTGGWSYVRFHLGQRGASGYRRSKLARWAARLVDLPARDTWVWFNNDGEGAALRDARTLTELLSARGADVRGPGPLELAASA